jgi:signal transduction histidine kinase
MDAGAASVSRIRWYDSLTVRVIFLCVFLVLCLLGSVYIITGRYFREVVQELEQSTQLMAERIEIWAADNPPEDFDPENLPPEFASSLSGDGKLKDIRLVGPDESAQRIGPAISQEGLVFLATRTVKVGPNKDQTALITVEFTLTPQREILRAFRNRYILALTTGFLAALILMVVLIHRTLRPLRDLSASCAKISEGKYEHVELEEASGEVTALKQTFNNMVDSLRDKAEVEARLRQTQRLSAVGTLAAGVAHDVRNPLNAIKLLSSHAMDSAADPALGDKLKTIRSEVDRLDNIVSGFLSLAKEQELKPKPTRVDTIHEECLRLVKQDAEARGVKLVSDLRAGDIELTLDPKQYTRAILNVLINALEVSPEGGRVRMFSRLTDTQLEVEIRDDGPGFDEDAAERAFDPYYTTKETGTGLGLSITRGIIEEHGGTIALSSVPGSGAQVLILLPLGQKATA